MGHCRRVTQPSLLPESRETLVPRTAAHRAAEIGRIAGIEEQESQISSRRHAVAERLGSEVTRSCSRLRTPVRARGRRDAVLRVRAAGLAEDPTTRRSRSVRTVLAAAGGRPPDPARAAAERALPSSPRFSGWGGASVPPHRPSVASGGRCERLPRERDRSSGGPGSSSPTRRRGLEALYGTHGFRARCSGCGRSRGRAARGRRAVRLSEGAAVRSPGSSRRVFAAAAAAGGAPSPRALGDAPDRAHRRTALVRRVSWRRSRTRARRRRPPGAALSSPARAAVERGWRLSACDVELARFRLRASGQSGPHHHREAPRCRRRSWRTQPVPGGWRRSARAPRSNTPRHAALGLEGRTSQCHRI